MTIHLQPEIFTIAPDFCRGVVIAENINNIGESEELQKALFEAQDEVKNLPNIPELPNVKAWDEVHRAFDSNPNKYPPAHKNLLKRIHKPDTQIPFISKVVAIMNIASLRLQTPVGGDDLDLVQDFGDTLTLCRASGDENFLPLGKNVQEEHPDAGEVVYLAGSTVMCRRWNWRNSCQTLISPGTKRIVMNVDCLGAQAEELAKKGTELIAQLLENQTQASVKTALLCSSNPSLPLES